MPKNLFIRKSIDRIQTLFAAAAYAESGEFESARQLINERSVRPEERNEAIRRRSRLRNAGRLSTR